MNILLVTSELKVVFIFYSQKFVDLCFFDGSVFFDVLFLYIKFHYFQCITFFLCVGYDVVSLIGLKLIKISQILLCILQS